MALSGFRHLHGYLDGGRQKRLLADVLDVVEAAPLFTPTMPRTGRPMSVRMTNCGELGWVTDKAGGYRYQAIHPVTGKPWPSMPGRLLEIWRDLAGCDAQPEACLVNCYSDAAKLGLHQDRDEQDLVAPVISLSLGDDAWFRIGGTSRAALADRLLLKSGDAVVLGGAARLAYHGVDRIVPGSCDLVRGCGLADVGRINLTLRRVTPRGA